MRIRTYLTLSYLGIVLFFTFGTVILAEWVVETMAERDLRAAEEAIKSVTESNLQLSEKLLTQYGMRIVEMKAEEVADRLFHRLGGRADYDYEELRKEEGLRSLATQNIPAYKRSSAGYVDVYDRTGLSVWHPNKDIEGRNFAEWKDEFRDMWKYVERSFTEDKVSGYYDFLDENSNRKRKFMVLVHVPETPFIVAATVNIDEFFKPVHDEITNRSHKATTQARLSIEDSSKSTQDKLRLLSVAGSLLLLGVGALFALWFAASVSRPIMRLRDVVARMGEGNWAVEVPEQGAIEVRHLGKSFNELGKQLTEYIKKRDFIRDTFGRYLTQEVAARLLESEDGLELGGESREITMIMSDIRGFTALIAGMQPQQVIFFLNRYLERMVEIIQNHGGVVDEIMGDGIFAFFGAPEPLEDHPARAVACALQMQAVIEDVNALNESEGFPAIEMGIAVHTGTVVVGNIGSEKRTKYGVVGSDVNLTGRIESYAVGGQVLISRSTYERMAQMPEVAAVLEVQMKGVALTSVLYDVTGLSEPYNIRLPVKKEELTQLRDNIEARLYTLDRKTVAGTALRALITHFSSQRVAVLSRHPLNLWEEMKVEVLDRDLAPIAGECYAKVISVKQAEGSYESLMRFTSLPSEVLEALRQAADGIIPRK